MIDIPQQLRAAVEADCQNAFTPEAMTTWRILAKIYGPKDVAKAVNGINLGVGKAELFDRLNEFQGKIVAPPPEWPVLRSEALDGPAGVIAQLAGDTSEADPVGVLITILTWAGAVFGPDVHVPVGVMRQPPRLFPVLTGESAVGRKGTVEHFARHVMDQVEKIHHTGGPLSSGEGIVYAVRDPSEELDDDGNPKDPGAADKRLLVLEAEFGAALKTAKRQGNTLSGILRMAWDSGDIAPLIKHNRTVATGAHVCIVGHVTPSELRMMLEQTEIWNGFANRILWTCVRRPQLVSRPKAIRPEQTDGAINDIREAVAVAKTRERIFLSDDAHDVWDVMYRKLTASRPGIYGVVTARAETQVLRIALIYALLDCSEFIEKKHLESARAVWDYCDASARFIFAGQMSDETKRFLDALEVGERSLQDMYRVFGNHKSKIEMNMMIQGLEGRGEIEQYKQPRANGSKGRMKIMFRLRRT